MLDRLDDVPWQSLRHAYGPAGDVPVMLRALAMSGEQQEGALSDLFGTIWHQGTIYEASSYAVPFLVELAMEPTVTRRDEILGLIGSLAAGNSYLATHAQPDLKLADFWRKRPEFEKMLEKESVDVRRTRLAVLEHIATIGRLLKDPAPKVRAAAAYVLSHFPELVSELGPMVRQAATAERNSLAKAGMLWCLGYARDGSPDTGNILDLAVHQSVDLRQAFAAAIALSQIRPRSDGTAHSLCRQLAAASWFAEVFLDGLPWHFSGDIPVEPLLADIEPDAAGATQSLMRLLMQRNEEAFVYHAIVHDLLQLNFTDGKWREATVLTSTQKDVLRQIVEADLVWNDTRNLWFLIPDGAKRISNLTSSDTQKARKEMSAVLKRAKVSL